MLIMPDFIYNGKVCYNPVEFTMVRLGGTCSMPILWQLKDKFCRCGRLKQSLKYISDKLRNSQFRELENEGSIHRKVGAVVATIVDNNTTERGRLNILNVHVIRKYGIELIGKEGIDIEYY